MDNPKILDNSLPQFQLRTYLSDLLTSDKYTEISIATDLTVIRETNV